MGYLPLMLEDPVVGTKRLLTNSATEDDQDQTAHTAKRRRDARTATAMADGAAGPEERQPADFNSLPIELKLAVIREVAYQPNRIDAREELANLWNTNKHMRVLINETTDIKESWDALQRNPGVKSRYIALCHDVVRGISVKDAIRQNGPLPKEDKLSAQHVNDALQYAGPQQFAPLAEEFSGRKGSANDKTFLTGVAYRAASTSTLRRADLEELATFAEAFTRHTDKEFIIPLKFVGSELGRRGPTALAQANIQEVAKLAAAFGTNEGKNYADRAYPPPASLTPQARQMHTNFLNTFGREANKVIEDLALTVTARDNELLRGASDEQLAVLKRPFSEGKGPSCPDAVEKIDALMEKHKLNSRSQLGERDRSRSQSTGL